MHLGGWASNARGVGSRRRFFEGELEACIIAQVAGAGAYFGQDVCGIIERLLGEQLEDGGWNCDAPHGSLRSSFTTTICVLEGLLERERAYACRDQPDGPDGRRPLWSMVTRAIKIRHPSATLKVIVSVVLPPSAYGRLEKAFMPKQLTAVIEREQDGYVALCLELDIASQGDTVEEARKNLREALELFFETASPEEVVERLQEEVYVTRVEVAVG